MEKDIDRIQKNMETDIVIRIDDFGGKRGVTIREFVKSDKYSGFTKAGTRIPAEKFALFKAAINSIDEKELLDTSNVTPASPNDTYTRKPASKPAEKSSKKNEETIDEIEDQEF